MGVELAKAHIALQLGKRYVQDELLDWGAAVSDSPEEEQEELSKAAHTLGEGKSEYKKAGSTLQAGRARKKNIS